MLIPLGWALTGPIAGAIGDRATLIAAGAINIACLAVIVALPSVWRFAATSARRRSLLRSRSRRDAPRRDAATLSR